MGCLFCAPHAWAREGIPTTCGSTGTSSGPDCGGLRDPKGRTPLHPIVGQLVGRREESDAAVMATEALKMRGREKALFKACFHGNKNLQRPLKKKIK